MTRSRLSWRLPFRAALMLAVFLPLVGTWAAFASRDADSEASDELTLADISWMSGHWRSEGPEGMTEELWMPARGRVMLGLNRQVSGTAHAQFEYLRVVQTKVDTYYWASPGGAAPTPFKMVEATKDHVVFENPEHDYPKIIEYRRKGDELTAQISGDEPGPSWTLKRIGDVE